ncbi:MAG: hypothetical protein K0B37_09625 [Bacteroidales bacterium]|nr:hypothetical protein [Bacteroidales bacterium]
MRKPVKNIFLSILVAFALSLSVKAQQISNSIEPSKILMGKPVELSFIIEFPDSLQLVMPVFNEQITQKIEILHYGKTDTLPAENRNNIRIQRTLQITSWEEGFHPVEPFTFRFLALNDTIEAESEPLLLEVEPFLMDEQTDLKDIKSVMAAPVTFREILPWLLIFLAVTAIVFGLIYYLKRRKPKVPAPTIWEKPDIPAHIAAISSLEKLKAQKLWQQGKIKQYHSELTDILRHYLEKRFTINAMEMTSAEIMSAFTGKPDDKRAEEILWDCLQLADLVKFAKHIPESNENEISMEAAFEFVNMTRLREVPKESKTGKSGSDS